MDIVKIVGISLIALILIILLKQYKPEFAIYISILTGILILFLVMDKLTRNNNINTNVDGARDNINNGTKQLFRCYMGHSTSSVERLFYFLIFFIC